MSGKVARKLRKIAERQFKADGGKYGIFHVGKSRKSNRTLINAYKNYYRGLKALYKQRKFILT